MAIPSPLTASSSFETRRAAVNTLIGEAQEKFDWFAEFRLDVSHWRLYDPGQLVVTGDVVARIDFGLFLDGPDEYSSGIAGFYEEYDGGGGIGIKFKVVNPGKFAADRFPLTMWSNGTSVFDEQVVFRSPAQLSAPGTHHAPIYINAPSEPDHTDPAGDPAIVFGIEPYDEATRVKLARGWTIHYDNDLFWLSTYDQDVVGQYSTQLFLGSQLMRLFDGLFEFTPSYMQFKGASNAAPLWTTNLFASSTAASFDYVLSARVQNGTILTMDALQISDSFGVLDLSISIARYTIAGTVYSTNREILAGSFWIHTAAGTILAKGDAVANLTGVTQANVFTGTRFRTLAYNSANMTAAANETIPIWVTSSGFGRALKIGNKLTLGGGITPYQTGTPETGGDYVVMTVVARFKAGISADQFLWT